MKKLVFVLLLVFAAIGAFAAAAAEPIVQATVTSYPSGIVPGNDGYLQVSFKNIGTATATQIKITNIFTEAPVLFGNWNGDIGPLAVGDSMTTALKFSVPGNTAPGIYSVTLAVDYCDGSSCKTIYPTGVISIQSSPSNLEVTSLSPKSLKLGESTKMNITITNRGNVASNIIFTMTSSDGALLPMGSTNRIVIPSIGANSYYEVHPEVVVNPSATPGIHSVIITLQYTDKAGLNQTIASTAGFEISGETDFDVTLQDYTTGMVTLSVINTGLAPAYSTVVRIPPQDQFKVPGSYTSVLGNLNSGDYSESSFQILPLKNATGGKLLVEISYTDMLGVRRSLQKEVLIMPTNTSAIISRGGNSHTINQGMTYIIIGIIGIAVIIAFVKLRKKIKRKS